MVDEMDNLTVEEFNKLHIIVSKKQTLTFKNIVISVDPDFPETLAIAFQDNNDIGSLSLNGQMIVSYWIANTNDRILGTPPRFADKAIADRLVTEQVRQFLQSSPKSAA